MEQFSISLLHETVHSLNIGIQETKKGKEKIKAEYYTLISRKQ